MKRTRTISRPEGYQANGLHEATLNSKIRGKTAAPIGSTTEPTETPKADTKVMSKEDKIQEDKIDDISQENDTMHNPDMGMKPLNQQTNESDDDMESPEENPNKEYGFDDDKVRRSNVVA